MIADRAGSSGKIPGGHAKVQEQPEFKTGNRGDGRDWMLSRFFSPLDFVQSRLIAGVLVLIKNTKRFVKIFMIFQRIVNHIHWR